MCGHGHQVMTFLLVLIKEMGKPENSAQNKTILAFYQGFIHNLPLSYLTKLAKVSVEKK